MRLPSSTCRRLFLVSTAACVVLISFAPRPHFAQRQQQTESQTLKASERSADDELMLTVTVANKRLGPVRGLSKSAFTVTDEKQPREITSFSNEDVPHSIGIVFDMSGSMINTELSRQVTQFFDNFLNASNQSNEYFLMAFAARPSVVVDWTSEMSGVLPRLVVKKTGQTALYNAFNLAIEKVKTGKYERRALIVITDGQDNNSQYSFREIEAFLRESDVTVYAVSGGDEPDPGSSLALDAKARLDVLTSTTGGKAFFPGNKQEMKAVFESIAAEIRSEYRIGLKLDAAAEKDKWRSIKVKVTPPQNAPKEAQSLVIRSRTGYYSNKRLR